MSRRPGYAAMARNLFNATLAGRLGTTVATQERNNRQLADEDLEDYWYELAEQADRHMADSFTLKRP